MAYEWLQTVGGEILTTTDNYTPSSIPLEPAPSAFNIGDVKIGSDDSKEFTFSDDLIFTMTYTNSLHSQIQMVWRDVPNSINFITSTLGARVIDWSYLMIAIDYSLEMAYPVYLLHFPDLPNIMRVESIGSSIQDNQKRRLYELIMGAVPPTYAWSSVPAISGKNGISFLSTIQSVYLNNGDPVNNAPANYIQFADDSNVAILVGEQVNDPTLVTIQYIVPTGTYEYIKLVYKVGSAPTSITDGTAVDILQANRSVTISGIANGNTYFFKIFTDVSESEPYEFTTTKPPIASNYVFELDLSTDGKDIVRYDATKDIGNHKQGELYGSGISIEDDILTASSWIYWDYDGTENPKFIPTNCTLTFEYDTFFPNGEGYLDWYIIDSNGTQQIYWCFDTRHAFQSNKWYNCKTVAKVQNGKIVRYKYVLDGNEVASSTADINMPCVNTETSLGISQIYFRLTRTTKFKNMSIYFDFSEYHDGGGSGSGSSGSA